MSNETSKIDELIRDYIGICDQDANRESIFLIDHSRNQMTLVKAMIDIVEKVVDGIDLQHVSDTFPYTIKGIQVKRLGEILESWNAINDLEFNEEEGEDDDDDI